MKIYPLNLNVSNRSSDLIIPLNLSKIVRVILIVLVVQGIALSQSGTDVHVELESGTLQNVFEQIQQQTQYTFAFNNEAIGMDHQVDIMLAQQELSLVLKDLMDKYGFDFNVIGNVIYAKKNTDIADSNPPKNDAIKDNALSAKVINGVVRDESTHETLIGATVYLKGTNIGVATDVEGRYEVVLPDNAQILLFSYIGYQDLEIEIGNRSIIDAALSPISTNIDEVIVVGYTEKRIKDLTGAVGVVKLDGVKAQPINGVEQALQGRVAGAQVTGDGSPGGGVSVRIRGYGTIGDNEPLYIIDGVPTKSGLNQFNVNDIASIQILKDAAATAIYGARAGNGVVIITTKKGNFKKDQSVTFDSYVGVQQASNLPEMLHTQDYADLLWQAQKNAGLIPSNNVFGTNPDAPTIPEFLNSSQTIKSSIPGTYWFDELFNPAFVQSYNLGYSAGTENGRMAFSASYFNQDGIMKYTGFDRYTLRANTEFKIKGNWLKLGENLSYSYSDQRSVPANAALGSRIIHAYRMNPIIPLTDLNGNWASSVRGVQGAENPVALNYFDRNDERITSRIFGNVYAVVEPLKDLRIKTDFGLDYEIFNLKNYSPRFQMGDARREVNSLTQVNRNTVNWVWNNTIQYKRTIDKHEVSGLIGTEAVKFTLDEFGASRDNFFTDDINFVFLSSGEGEQTNFGEGTEWALYSLFGRLDYSYNEKYLLGASIRRDGSSRFTKNNRFATFSAFSIGWRLSEEIFVKEVDFIDDLKLRLSWGESGNQEIGDFAAFSSFTSNSNDSNYDLNGTNTNVVTGFAASRLGNPNIVWETTRQSNIGIDASLFDYHLNFSVDYFIKNTDDMLLQRPTLSVEGQAEPPFVNAGRMQNKGLEVQLGYISQNFGKFSFDINGNISVIRNKVLELADDVEFIPGFVSNSSTRNLTISRTQEGMPIAQIYGHQVEGIFKSQEEVEEHAVQPGKAIGRLRFADLNDDGIVDDKDRTFIGNPHPDFVYGLNLKAKYQNLELTAFAQGVQGNNLYNFTRYYTDFYFDLGNRHSRILGSWSPENTDALIPRISSVDVNNELRPSSYFVENGSFLRLKTLQLAYTFNIASTHISKVRTYIQGSHVFTITDYQGLDPEVSLASHNSRNRNLDLGVDRGIYPNSRTISVGVNLEF